MIRDAEEVRRLAAIAHEVRSSPPETFERPPANGPYRGRLPVRVLPPGASGVAYGHDVTMRAMISKGHAARERRLQTRRCSACGALWHTRRHLDCPGPA